MSEFRALTVKLVSEDTYPVLQTAGLSQVSASCPLIVRDLSALSRSHPGYNVGRNVVRGGSSCRINDIFQCVKKIRLADGVGFEPTVSFHPRRFSRPLP